MKNVKLVVIYPRPKDVDAFEHVYQTEHVPLAVARLAGKTKMVATKVLASPQGTPPFYGNRRGLLSVDASSGRMRSFGWRERSVGPCRRGRDFQFHQTSRALFLNQLMDVAGETAAL